jgi:hypothetical protein
MIMTPTHQHVPGNIPTIPGLNPSDPGNVVHAAVANKPDVTHSCARTWIGNHQAGPLQTPIPLVRDPERSHLWRISREGA